MAKAPAATLALTPRDELLDRYMAEVKAYKTFSREEEFQLALRYKDYGDLRAAHLLVLANLRFVVKIAHEYNGYGFKLLDLIQEGNIGLMMAVKKFDPHKGYRLISYAVWWIKAYMQAFILRSWSLVKLGSSRIQRKLFFKLRSERAAAERLAASLPAADVASVAGSSPARPRALRGAAGTPVTTEGLAERLEVSPQDITNMEFRFAARDFSLDAHLYDDNALTHLDLLADDQVRSPEETLSMKEEQHLLKGKVAETLEELNEKERYIVANRLCADEPKSLQEIGDEFQVSRERIRQLEARIINKLKNSFKAATTGLAPEGSTP